MYVQQVLNKFRAAIYLFDTQKTKLFINSIFLNNLLDIQGRFCILLNKSIFVISCCYKFFLDYNWRVMCTIVFQHGKRRLHSHQYGRRSTNIVHGWECFLFGLQFVYHQRKYWLPVWTHFCYNSHILWEAGPKYNKWERWCWTRNFKNILKSQTVESMKTINREKVWRLIFCKIILWKKINGLT